MKTEAEPLRMHSQAEPGNDLQTSKQKNNLKTSIRVIRG